MQNNIDSDQIRDDIYYLISNINDPEFPQTLGELKVIQLDDIAIQIIMKTIHIIIYWTPTVKHFLALRVKLQRELQGYKSMKLKILVKPGTHQKEQELNRQSNDKERYRAAMENEFLMEFIENMIRER